MAQSFNLATLGSTPTQYGLGTTLPKQSNVLSGYSLGSNSQLTKPVTQGTNPGLITPQPTTAVKKTTTADGTTTEYHAPTVKAPDDPSNKYNTATGQLNPNYKDPNAPVVSQQTQNGMINPSTGTNANGSTSSSVYTPPNQGTTGVSQGGLIGNAVQQSQAPSAAYTVAQTEANRINQQLEDAKKQMAQQTSDINQSGTWTSRALGEQGQANIQNSATLAALGSQYQGAQQQLGAANTQQGLQQSALGTALGYNAPQQVSPTNVPFNPSSGTYGAPASTAYGAGGLANVGAALNQQDQGAQTQNMIGAYNQAKPLIETAKQQIANSTFNTSPLALANQLQQWVNKDVVPSGEYANIFNTLSEIATTISPVLGAQGAQTNLKTMIAQEFIPRLMQGSTISSVLDNIETNALAKIQANKSTAQGTPLQVPTKTSGSTTGSNIWNF